MKAMKAESESAYERLRADIANREVRLILAMAAIVALGLTLYGFIQGGA